MRIRWSLTARSTYFNILDYLTENWTFNEIERFIENVDSIIIHIATFPEIFPISNKGKGIRKGFITKDISLYYKLDARRKEIVLLAFWDNRRNPESLMI